jgi:hypothetical protein
MREAVDATRIGRFMAEVGRAAHFELVSQALAKIERGHAQDRGDVAALIERGLATPEALRVPFEAIARELYRYPAVDPASFRRAVEDVLRLHERDGKPD